MHVGIYKMAIDEAEKSEYFPYKIGAVIFKKSRIISTGYNELRFHKGLSPRFKKYNNSLHAEQKAILNVNFKLCKKASLLVVRINSQSGNISNAYPCQMCMKLIKLVGIKEIYWTDRGGEIKYEKL